MKLRTITSVHVGTGEEKYNFEYHEDGNVYKCYDLYDLLSTLPPKMLLDEKFLNKLNKRGNDTKGYFVQEFSRMINYRNVKPLYECDAGYDLGTKNVKEQMKALNVPIIPGSSLKGTITNAITYCFIKHNFQIVRSNLSKVKNKKNIDAYMALIFGKDINAIKKFLIDVRGCLLCSDINFVYMEMLEGTRLTKKSDIQLGLFECIAPDQTSSGNFVSFRKHDNRISEYHGVKELEFINLFSNENIVKCCNEYFMDMMMEEKKADHLYKLCDCDSIIALENKLVKECKALPKNSCYIRIGKNTDYFFKSIAGLFKKEAYDFYSKNFYEVFCPVGINRAKKLYIKPNSLPTTRVILEGFGEETLGGFVELIFDD